MNETEVKLHIPDLKSIEARLLELGAHLEVGRVFERNVRYDDVDGTMIPNGVVLRLRRDHSVRLTYKEAGQVQDGIVSRLELEVEVSDFAVMEAILAKLGYAPYMIYEKYRTTYAFMDTEIVLDEMPFGDFLEVEGTPEAIERVLELLELEQTQRIPYSYARLFDFVRKHLNLTFNDLTFENFAGIDVPARAFMP